MAPEERSILPAFVAQRDGRRMVTIALACVLVGGAAGTAVAASVLVGDRGPTATDGGIALSTAQADAANQTQFVGGGEGDRLGQAVAAAGDVNGDGIADLAVGAPSNDTGGPDAGAVYLFFGPVESDTRDISDADAKLVGEAAGDWAGFAVAAGDLNGDGFSDVVVGAPRADYGGNVSGAVYVVYGGDSMSGRISLSDASAKLVGERAGTFAGFSVAARDADAPDRPSILVGAPTNLSAARTGSAHLLAANSLSGTASLSDADATLVGEAEGDVAGWAVAWAGDVTNDSVADVVIGAPAHDVNDSEDAGAAYVVGTDVEGTARVANVADAKLFGTSAGDNFGFAVAGAGDANGDGVADLLVGAPFDDRRGSNAGAGHLFFGADSLSGPVRALAAPVSVFGEAPGDRFGWSVAGAGDVDCDDRSDVLVGAPYRDATARDAGATYLIYGKSTAESVAVVRLAGDGEGDLAGFDVGGGGDVAGDDGADVLVGAPFHGGETVRGAAYLWPGACNASTGT